MKYLFAFLFLLLSHISWSQSFVFSDGVIATLDTTTELYGFKDSNDHWVIPPRFFEVQDFKNGLAPVWENPNRYVDEGSGCGTPVYHPSWGYIDLKGSYIIPSKYHEPGTWENNNLIFVDYAGNTTTYNKEGKLIDK